MMFLPARVNLSKVKMHAMTLPVYNTALSYLVFYILTVISHAILQRLLKSQKRAFLTITLQWFKDVVDRYYNYLIVSASIPCKICIIDKYFYVCTYV